MSRHPAWPRSTGNHGPMPHLPCHRLVSALFGLSTHTSRSLGSRECANDLSSSTRLQILIVSSTPISIHRCEENIVIQHQSSSAQVLFIRRTKDTPPRFEHFLIFSLVDKAPVSESAPDTTSLGLARTLDSHSTRSGLRSTRSSWEFVVSVQLRLQNQLWIEMGGTK